MSKHDKNDKHDRRSPQNGVPQVDDAFEPWEQVRPIPLFVIAVIFALAFWGLLTYLSEYAAQRHAVEKNAEKSVEKSVAVAARKDAAGNDPAGALRNADTGTLALVGLGNAQAWSCASCHGDAGQGNLSTPRLAGQPAEYLKKQLLDFASGMRENESMRVVARSLSTAEMENLARYYAQLDLPSAAVPTLGGDLERGKVLAQQGDWKTDVPACFSCHGLSGEGVAPGFPALAGQQPDYIFGQLAAWHAGERKNSPQALMDGIAQRMSTQDMRAVADYLGSLPARPAGVQADARAGAGMKPSTQSDS